ncbi:MAG: DUF2061 domain-containing protein [Gammaproteobacteria bacterium]|nr:DUF2061 domain-containing protein [Gammaproteobacteria bacterium]MCP5426110.1 DUF2061 domain-containing protein [Gammaproteobacteria bacterium]MCP5460001.1 DUF2061 domain-containing protein [Gammaproteobacteria bacterium]
MLKTFTFALVHMSVAFSVVYLMTGDLLAGGVVALIEPACNTVAYHFHEKAWATFRQPRGLQQEPSRPLTVTCCPV